MPIIELQYPVLGNEIPADHGYVLYSALSRLVPKIHDDKFPLHISSIRGSYQGNRTLRLENGHSWLRIRMASDELPTLLPLAGKRIELDGHMIRLGVPRVFGLTPTNLTARIVVIKASSPKVDPGDKKSRDRQETKRYQEPAAFLDGVRHEMKRKGILADADLPLHEDGPRSGQPRRHVLRIRSRIIVGFSVIVQGLTAEESVKLQEEGLGGRGKMGCGFFSCLLPRTS